MEGKIDRRTHPERVSRNENIILNFICNFIERNAYSPTIREIQEQSPLNSLDSIYRYMKKLRSKGFIDWEPSKPRTIRIIQKENSAS